MLVVAWSLLVNFLLFVGGNTQCLLSFGLLKNYQCHLTNVVHANVTPDGGEKLCHFSSVGLCLAIGFCRARCRD